MTSQIVIKTSQVSPILERQPRLTGHKTSPAKSTRKKSTSNVGEVAGGTTANICILCCCCPCVPVEFLILAVYKVPANVVRRLWKSQGRRKILMIKKIKRKNRGVVQQAKEEKIEEGKKEKVGKTDHKVNGGVHADPVHYVVGYVDELSDVDLREFEKVKISIDGSAEAVELDKQMWDRFKDAGFWRSPSQRLDGSIVPIS